MEALTDGRLKEALQSLYIEHPASGNLPNIYARLLQGCIDMKALSDGKRIHTHMIKCCFQPRTFLWNRLLEMYAKSGSLTDARQVFDKMPERDIFSWTAMFVGYVKDCNLKWARQLFDEMPERDVVSWNAILAGYVEHGVNEEALNLFGCMRDTGIKPDNFTFTSILSACSSLQALEQGKKIHGTIIRLGFETFLPVSNALVAMYGRCYSIEEACQVFKKMPVRAVLSWVTMITAHVQCGNVDYAREMFDIMPEQNIVSWNAMLAGYAQHGYGEEALDLFRTMQRTGMLPDCITFVSLVSACTSCESLEHGKQVHAHVIKSGFEQYVPMGNAIVGFYANCKQIEDANCFFQTMPNRNVVSWNTMITGYVKHDRLEDAEQLFHEMPTRSLISWTAMIAGYAQHGHSEQALNLFSQMKLESSKPDQFTFGSILSACASLSVLEHGKQVHGHIIQTGSDLYVSVNNAVITMYAKCGSIEDAQQMFKSMPEQDTVSWNAIIAGCAQNGFGKKALNLFEQMQTIGTVPNHITFIGVLCACSHTGLVEEGWRHFIMMSRVHSIKPEVDHYTCMVDLLGRAGQLGKAEELINSMPLEPDTGVWEALLGACKIHKNMQLGMRAAGCLIELNPQCEATYVLLSNIYAANGKWDDVAKVRKIMKERGIAKKPGWSWIEIKNRVHAFIAGDRSHPQTQEIYETLGRLTGKIKEVGYVPETDIVLHDVEEGHKEENLSYHSEKLAVACGLINMPDWVPIRVVKNLRVCGDCHSAMKFISKVVQREVVLRDINRFHHFKNGSCSCSDYW
ncbi:pentatricopeptide repeat-containing protein At2g22070 [Cryptomeria japonica]|uniref:pentatricopeptide repeat-containing protein At2g22070 n=1 Tax=Cryptomeria japonica TaxID=3369 RepID=UPI0025ABE322|nr:pentatricopeptide repeat-containing protein At2g22070 [Cryptomeria japonica]